MARVLIDLDPRLLSQLRALANRRGFTVDQVLNEVLRGALPGARRNAAPASAQQPPAARPTPVSYEYDDDEPSESDGPAEVV